MKVSSEVYATSMLILNTFDPKRLKQKEIDKINEQAGKGSKND